MYAGGLLACIASAVVGGPFVFALLTIGPSSCGEWAPKIG
jgi:hypothetical protein